MQTIYANRATALRAAAAALAIALLALAGSAFARTRIIIDTDAACERYDQHALAYALLSPEHFDIVGFTAVHNGPGTLERNFLEIHHMIGINGTSGIPVLRGAEQALPDMDTPRESAAARFIIEQSRAKSEGELVVMGIGAATNLASAILMDPSVTERVRFVWMGGADWPDGEGGEHNMVMDIAAARVLLTSEAKFTLIPNGNNVMFQTRYHSARAMRGVSPLGDYLNYLMTANRWTMDESFNIADLAGMAVMAHPEYASWSTSPAPWIDDSGGFDWSQSFGEITVATNLVEHIYGGPVPVWNEFYDKVNEAAPPEPQNLREELCRVLNIHPADPDVAAWEGPVEKHDGFLRQEVRWPTIFGEEVPAYVCIPENAGGGKLPAVICLSGTGGDRIVLTMDNFGRHEYTSFGSDEPHNRLVGWAAEITRRGYITLSMTQRGLGDRGRTSGDQSKKALLRGFTSQGIHAHEIRQALTYLSRREDVDPERIACTGMSFGGITTFYTTAADSRFKAAAPLCGGVGSLRVMTEIGSMGYHGHYWWIPRILQHFDQPELVAAQAPRPYFIAAPLDDIGMPRQGVTELLEKARPAYQRAGAPEALVAFRPEGPHSFTMEIFEELVSFFDNYL